ncbi:MAG: hypothetical protein IIW02_04060 [Clostridia bacterium]|nr:hypothetical protein [Clostridia bacterium]
MQEIKSTDSIIEGINFINLSIEGVKVFAVEVLLRDAEGIVKKHRARKLAANGNIIQTM